MNLSALVQSVVFVTIVFLSFGSLAQKNQDVYVDKSGVMRWGDTKEEVYGFGVNYTAPFAHAYRSAARLNVNLEKAISQDVYHFARLGFDAFRVHVWDTEISDSLGNLLENDQLRLFDFTLHKLKERGIKIIITPIAFWGNGYPEPDEKTPGFSNKYGKEACLVNADAIKAQENYLYQFLNHVNPYTGIAYKNDPDIIGFEVSNEPHHKGTPAEVKAYINRMVASMRRTGCKKPILYNVSHSVHLGEAYFDSNIDGGTFQWYPTGLGAAHELRGNFLPNVDKYIMPFDHLPSFKSMAKIVYEFDAADVGRSYIYPAMARSFREAGIQWATHFAYDPTFLAYANTEYNTHYMNLLYAPQKALSLKISGEVFHQVPRYKTYGSYPSNATFDGFHVSYEDDLAEYVSDKKFLYTNSTATQSYNTASLQEIAGYGNSNLVKYEGKGAYFIDKISAGVWRLEVYPDAIWVDNIFGKNNLEKEVAVLKWSEWPMEINLPDLGENFVVRNLRDPDHTLSANGTTVNVKPGVYLLSKHNSKTDIDPKSKWKNIRLNEYGAEESVINKIYVLHQPLKESLSNKPLTIRADVVAATKPDNVQLYLGSGFRVRSIPMKKTGGYTYEATIDAQHVKPGYLTYFISVNLNDSTSTTFPSRTDKSPGYWDFPNQPGYTTPVLADSSSLHLFNAVSDANEVSREWRPQSGLIPDADGTARMLTVVPKLFVRDEENLTGKPVYDYSMRYNFSDKIAGRLKAMGSFSKIVIRGHSINAAFPIQVALIDKHGNTFGGIVNLDTEERDFELEIKNLKQTAFVILPRPYPTFLPYYFQSKSTAALNMADVETIQISVGPGLSTATQAAAGFSLAIESIRLEK